MDAKLGSEPREKAPLIITMNAQEIIDQLNAKSPLFVEAVDRLGGGEPPVESEKITSENKITLPFVEGDSFLLDLFNKINRIKELVVQNEKQITRLNNLV